MQKHVFAISVCVLLLLIACSPAKTSTPVAVPQKTTPAPVEPARPVTNDVEDEPLDYADVAITFTKCFATRYGTTEASNVNLEASGTASGPVGMILEIRSDKTPTATLKNCGAWTLTESKTCVRGEGHPAQTTWQGKDVALVPGAQSGREIRLRPAINTGGGLRYLDADAVTVTCD